MDILTPEQRDQLELELRTARERTCIARSLSDTELVISVLHGWHNTDIAHESATLNASTPAYDAQLLFVHLPEVLRRRWREASGEDELPEICPMVGCRASLPRTAR